EYIRECLPQRRDLALSLPTHSTEQYWLAAHVSLPGATNARALRPRLGGPVRHARRGRGRARADPRPHAAAPARRRGPRSLPRARAGACGDDRRGLPRLHRQARKSGDALSHEAWTWRHAQGAFGSPGPGPRTWFTN